MDAVGVKAIAGTSAMRTRMAADGDGFAHALDDAGEGGEGMATAAVTDDETGWAPFDRRSIAAADGNAHSASGAVQDREGPTARGAEKIGGDGFGEGLTDPPVPDAHGATMVVGKNAEANAPEGPIVGIASAMPATAKAPADRGGGEAVWTIAPVPSMDRAHAGADRARQGTVAEPVPEGFSAENGAVGRRFEIPVARSRATPAVPRTEPSVAGRTDGAAPKRVALPMVRAIPSPPSSAEWMPKALGANLAQYALELRTGPAAVPQGTVVPITIDGGAPASDPVPPSRIAPFVAQALGASGPSRLTLRLHPAALGEVEVEIVRRGGMVAVEMRADTPEAVRALEAERSAMEAQLRGRGEADARGIAIEIGLRDERRDADRQQHGGSGANADAVTVDAESPEVPPEPHGEGIRLI